MTDEAGAWGRAERPAAAAFTGALLACVLWPLRQNWRPAAERRDGFPLSYYPMFSARRRATVALNYVLVEDRRGGRRCLAHRHLGPGGLNQVRRQLNRMVTEGAADVLARDIAARLAGTGAAAEIGRVHVVRGRFHLDRCFEHHQALGREELLATAELPG